MAFEQYIYADGKKLRCGYTTGTCAALAAGAASRFLLTGTAPKVVSLKTPKGIVVQVPVQYAKLEQKQAVCGVVKDGGDDQDATHGLLIVAQVAYSPHRELTIQGGAGVGKVTKPGLDQPVGAYAINHVPRQMIMDAVHTVCDELGYKGGLVITISVPDGEQVAKKTYNPHMGIVGGISILGTSGIVEPMSVQAIVDTIALELRQGAMQGEKRLVLTPGNYGTDFLKSGAICIPDGILHVKCSNFVGESLDLAKLEGFEEILLVGHIGKFVKLAGGIMNTHSRWADGRAELFCAHAALCGASQQTAKALMDSATADRCLEILEEHQLKEAVLDSLLMAIQTHLSRRVGQDVAVGAILFSNQFGYLGQTEGAKEILNRWNKKH